MTPCCDLFQADRNDRGFILVAQVSLNGTNRSRNSRFLFRRLTLDEAMAGAEEAVIFLLAYAGNSLPAVGLSDSSQTRKTVPDP